MRRNGQGYAEIADHLGIDPWTAQQLVGIAYRRIAAEEVHELRAAVEDRLDDVLRRLHQDLSLADDQNTRNGIYRLILSTEAQRSKLLGLDIPAGTPDAPAEGGQ
ncbi:hypothetical protein C5C29_06020 [Rathayibacter sp. AY1H2]|nr:hypothetical protein C5C29_06020 [Rathayibacter sp. AY1H2]